MGRDGSGFLGENRCQMSRIDAIIATVTNKLYWAKLLWGKSMRKPEFSFLTTKEIKPEGWLRRQLEIQAEGLSGHLDLIWPDIRDSKWIGGDKDGWRECLTGWMVLFRWRADRGESRKTGIHPGRCGKKSTILRLRNVPGFGLELWILFG